MDYFQLMPSEIIVRILQLLPCDTLINSVSPVSKAFRQHVINALTAVEYYYIPETAAGFWRFFKRLTSVQTLYLSLGFPEINYFEEIDLPSSPSLRKLVIKSDGSYHLRITTFSAYPNLQFLKMNGVRFTYDRKNDDHGCLDEKQRSAITMLRQQLRKLTLNNFCGSFNFLGSVGDSLRELKIQELPFLQPSEYEVIANTCKVLEKFHCKTYCDVHSVVILLVSLPLKELKICSLTPAFLCRERSPVELIKQERDMHYFFSRVTGLEKCGFNAVPEFNDTVLGYMAKYCARLKCVTFSNLDDITNTGIVDLISSQKSLKELHIKNCFGCSEEHIASCISSLRKINFSFIACCDMF